MRCDDVQEKFSSYWSLSEDDMEREAIEAHLLECEHCAEQFRLWEESDEMIRFFSEEDPVLLGPAEHVNRTVMDRIYAEQSWLMPVAHKSYQFSKSFRRNLSLVIAGCMAMFACALIYFVTGNENIASPERREALSGLMDTANASGSGMIINAQFEVPVASISDPFVLQVVPSLPQYWVALSLLGMVIALLILNWLSRTRS